MRSVTDIELPISKSIANRWLMLQAIHRDELMPVSVAMPDDVVLLHHALQAIEQGAKTIDIGNCGTAMRFLTAYCAQREGEDILLTGCDRMQHRPIGQLVDALRELGAEIEYMGEEGYPPLQIRGKRLRHQQVIVNHPVSTQFVSALLLIGMDVQTDTDSPYIQMTRHLCETYNPNYFEIERDWSSAAFWYEYVALHGGALRLEGLRADSLQGDKAVVDIFSQLGVSTTFEEKGVLIRKTGEACRLLKVDFQSVPDLYPAVAITCEQLGISLTATGTEALPLKESNRLESVRVHQPCGDHRVAMALLAADLPCDDRECISKSYPLFAKQLANVTSPISIERVIPRRGVNDEGKGKKFALRKLITASTADYVWLTDDDVELPLATMEDAKSFLAAHHLPDMVILPLRMKNGDGSVLCKLQQAEYAAIQQVTIDSAKRGRAVMCSGANLIVRREKWLEAYPDLHPELASGDDMFLLESFKRRQWKIDVWDAPVADAWIDPELTIKALFRQRMRWAGKANKYKDKEIRLCCAVVGGLNMLQALCLPVMLVKFPCEYHLIKKRDVSVSLSVALLLGIIYPWYMLICLLGGIIRNYQQHSTQF